VEPGRATSGRPSRILAGLAVAVVCALALRQGLATTSGLHWPYDEDLYRDIAQARTMADGAWLADPFYLGESIWYNPLGPALVAIVSKLTALPVNEASVRIGPWLGLLAPLAFALFAATLLGRRGALAALVIFVFVTPGRLPGLLCATYSPWPFGAQLAQAPFFLGLAALVKAQARPQLRRFVLAGGLLGLTFLAHTAPALVLGAVAATVVAWGPLAGARRRQRFGWLAALLATAVVVASPFLWSIVVRYRLRVVNREPGGYVWTGMGLDSLSGGLALGLGRPVLAAIVLLGLVAIAAAIVRRPSRFGGPGGRLVVLSWLGWNALLLAYSLARPAWERRGLGVPPLVPAFHFWALLGAAVSLLAAFGAVWLGERLAAAAPIRPEHRARVAELAAPTMAFAAALVCYPAWLVRDDFVEARRLAEFHGSWEDRNATHLWVRAHTAPGDVFLAEHDPGLRVVATAGRKLVAMDSGFSNPFVPWQPRAEAAARMLSSLHPGGHDVFHPLAVAYHVSYVLVERERAETPFPDAPFLTLVFKKGNFAVYRTGCWPERSDGPGR
jgi:hypothetical protein